MATTPNYGFIMPDPTDFVTALPADFEIFGDEVDLRVKALNPETTEGDLAYRGATADAKDRLGIGTAGQVLAVNSGATAPEWVTPAGGGGMTLISTGTLTGASINLTAIPATFKDLKLVIRSFRPVSDSSIRLRLQNDSATRYESGKFNPSGVSFPFGSNHIVLSDAQDSGNTNSLIVVNIHDYTNTQTFKVIESQTVVNDETTPANFRYGIFTGFYNQTVAINQINLFPTTGNFTSGTFLLYGVN